MNKNTKKVLAILEDQYAQKNYIFRGQADHNFLLMPNFFRFKNISDLFEIFPFKVSEYYSLLNESIELQLAKVSSNSLVVKRLAELTLYTMAYNYKIAEYVANNKNDFDTDTIKMYALRDSNFWVAKKTFKYLFEDKFRSSTALIGFDGKILKYSNINEEITCYDDSLPQHYGVPTAAFDWTKNPYTAIYFAIRKAQDTKFFSVYSYKEIDNSPKNPFSIEHGNLSCNNPRILAQEGLFVRFKYAILYYFFHGNWPSMEVYYPLSPGNVEIKKYDIEISEKKYLVEILKQKNIDDNFLKL